MLISLNNIEKLEQTLSEDGNPESLLRLASYYESQEDYEAAMEYYKKADDIQNVIRLYLKENKKSTTKSNSGQNFSVKTDNSVSEINGKRFYIKRNM